jgi:very-short-patch-repair endonuclease
MRHKLAKPDRTVAEIAARQHGVVTRKQLLWAGLSPKAITRRVQAGRLHRLYRGVYAVGHTNLSREGRWLGAVFACGEGAVLSHASAAHLWKISPTSPSTIHVTVPATSGRTKRPGIRLHNSTALTPSETTQRRGIPVTTHARTLRDLGYDREPTRSDLERLFLRICREHRIPKPEVNVKVGPYRVDFLWREERLIAETDGYRYHSGRDAFEADLARTNHLKRLGFEVLRFSYREVSEEPLGVVASLRVNLHDVPRTG